MIDPKDIPYRRACFEIHIRPMMRLIDHDHMLFRAPEGQRMDLFSYDDVKKHANGIYGKVAAGDMPCDGPWPQDKVTTFKQWVDAGTPRS